MNKKTVIAVFVSVVVVGVLIGGGLINGLFTQNKTQDMTNDNAQASSVQELDSGLKMEDKVVGTGDVAVAGKQVTVHYIGVFTDGKKFDSSVDRGVPFTFTLGSGMVIKGWDLGVEGMKVGGKRILIVPPQLGYGANDYQSIPGNSTLIFQVELLGVK